MIEKEKIYFPDHIYQKHLFKIKNIKFTPQEIKIIAFTLSGRSAKTTASFFSISSKTVESHIRNIKKKLGCNSRDGVVDFIEKSGNFADVKRYYLSLLIHTEFENILKKLSTSPTKIKATLVQGGDQDSDCNIVPHLKHHLKLAGILVSVEYKRNPLNLFQAFYGIPNASCRIYILPKDICLNVLNAELASNLTDPATPYSIYSNKVFICPKIEELALQPNSLENLGLINDKNYYFMVFEILKRLLPHLDIDRKVTEFNESVRVLLSYSNPLALQYYSEEEIIEKQQDRLISKLEKFLRTKKWKPLSALAGCFLCGIGLLVLSFKDNNKAHAQNHIQNAEAEERTPMITNLVSPLTSTFLNRPALLNQIEEKLKRQEGIQTVLLVGIGGTGKTTLARHFGHSSKFSITWEINAETPESLRESFESLAFACSQTDAEKKKLRDIKEIKNQKEKEEKILHLVQKYLKANPNWLLIYDNVEKVGDIQNYFPFDYRAWGKGKVIITTRGTSMNDNTNSIQIEELKPDEKFALFLKIMQQEKGLLSKEIQKEKAQKFLEAIPPFPLDVTIASHYLKETNISYDEYLGRLMKCDKQFDTIQQKIIEEVSGYKKTRYGILALSLQKILESHEEFKDLLVLMSLINSENIPRNLLNAYKSEEIVDNFIFHIKKYHLITPKLDTSTSNASLSIHRSIQTISLKYLIKVLNLKNNRRIILQSAQVLENYIISRINQQDYTEMECLKNHSEAFLRHTELLNDNINGIIGSKLGVIYFYIGKGLKSKQVLEENLQKFKKYYDQNYGQHAWVLGYLGLVYYRELGGYEKAKDILEQSLMIYKENKSENHIDVGRSLLYLGMVCIKIGKFGQAKSLFEESLLMHKQHYAEDHFNVAFSLACLGSAHCELGNYETAKIMLEESLNIYKKHFSENHLNIAWLLVHLGNVHMNLGDYKKAQVIFEKSIKTYKELFSEDYIDTARILVLLAYTHGKLKNYDKSKEILEKCLIIYEQCYGKDHIEIADVLNKLGEIYFLQGYIEPAEDCLLKALKIYQDNKHVEIYKCFENLSELYLKRAKSQKNPSLSKNLKKQSILYLKQALNTVETNFPLNSPHKSRIQLRLTQLISN